MPSHWERGSRCHGLWDDATNTRLALVVREDSGYRWLIDGPYPEIEGTGSTLTIAKLRAEQAAQQWAALKSK